MMGIECSDGTMDSWSQDGALRTLTDERGGMFWITSTLGHRRNNGANAFF